MPDKNQPRRSADTSARRLSKLMRQAKDDWFAQAEALPLRRDMVTLLTYLHENLVKGTKSTGNLPLKAVREVTARFVNPPALETTIGDYTYRVRSEDEVWPLVFLHTLAYVGGLLEGGPAQPWVVTPYGAQFLIAEPLIQVWLLLVTWWKYVDWLVAYPFVGMGDSLPPRFKETTLAHLLALPVETRIPFEPFADKLIEETGLKWGAEEAPYDRILLHGAIERMVIDILADFGAVECEYRDEPLGKGTIKKLAAFQITSFGRGLLESLEA